MPIKLQYQQIAVPILPQPNAATAINFWFSPLSEPVRLKPSPAAQQQAQAYVPLVATCPPISWFNALSDPLRSPRQPVQQSQAVVPFVPSPTVTVAGWLAPLSERLSAKPGLHASQQQFLARYDVLPVADVLVGGWATALAEPVRSRPGLLPGLYQDLACILLPPNPIILPGVYNWGWQNLATPRFPFGFAAHLQPTTGSLGPILPIPNPPGPPPATDAIYTVSGGPVDDLYPASGVSWIPPTGLGTQKRTL